MMQNNESNHFVHFWKTKGYYMLMVLCLVAVGVSAWLFVSGALKEKQAVEESLSVPVTAQEPAAQQSVPQTGKPSQTETLPASGEAEEAEPSEPVGRIVEETVLPVSGTVVQDYAMDHLTYNATTRDWRVHNGVDLAAEAGAEVKAAADGQVYTVFEDDAMGTTVVIRHQDGYTTKYASLAENVSVKPGDTVTMGQVIGYASDTALVESTLGAHVHFGVTCNDLPVDPAEFLQLTVDN